jgi:type I restriction enzyme, S subunit
VRWRQLKYYCSGPPQYGLNVGADEYTHEGVRLLRTTDINDDGTLVSESFGVFVAPDMVKPRYSLREGDLLFSRSGSLGRCFRVRRTNELMTFAGYLVRFRPRHGVNPRYLEFCAASRFFQAAIYAEAITSTISNFNAERYGNLRIPEWNTSSQTAIADFLDRETSRIDALMSKKCELMESLGKRLDALVMREIRGLDLPGEPFDGRWFNHLPLGWRVAPTKSVTDFINGYPFAPSDWHDEGTSIIRISNLNEDSAFNRTKLVLPSRWRVTAGDLLFGWSGNRGTSFGPHLWRHEGEYYLNQHVFRLEPNSVELEWLYWALRAATPYVEELAHGIIGMVHITKQKLGSILLPVPPMEVQREIASRLAQADARIAAVRAALDRQVGLLQEHRQALITAAVTGELDGLGVAG